jgi:putative protein-disulfide isomerase
MENIKAQNPLMCDPETGICEVAARDTEPTDIKMEAKQKPVRLLYFTDPICSSCWGIEPQLRKLKLEYGEYFDIEYRMGGLLKSWDSYGGRDVSGPRSVSQHWDEASDAYQMPIDGSVWLEDPLDSSYPPSIAFKAAQIQSDEKALVFLRGIKEMVFLAKKNIAKWEHLEDAATQAGLDIKQFKIDFEGKAKELFEEDMALARSLGVRGFPTIFFMDEEGNRFLVYGARKYEQYVEALLKLYPNAEKKVYDKNPESLFGEFSTLTLKEFAELTEKNLLEAETVLDNLHAQKLIDKFTTRNGAVWRKIA